MLVKATKPGSSCLSQFIEERVSAEGEGQRGEVGEEKVNQKEGKWLSSTQNSTPIHNKATPLCWPP
jgi:hypothetical protein